MGFASSDFPTRLQRVFIYLRKSREDREAELRAQQEGREDELETLAKHRRALLNLAYRYEHNIVHIYEEVVSGEYIAERPEMIRLLRAVESAEADAVWCMDLDRLGRGDMFDQGQIIRAFKDSNTLILTPDKVYDLSNEMDEEWTEFQTFMARRELKMITKRMQRGRVASVQDGKYIGTRPPFGYDVSKDLVLVPNDDADTIRLIYDLYVNHRMGCNRIAARLNELELTTSTGKLWRGETVVQYLKNPVYAGWIVWKKVKVDKRKGTFHQRPRDEWIVARGKHLPIITQELYDKATELRQKKSIPRVPKSSNIASPLTGLVICKKCGYHMIRRPYGRQLPHLMCANPHCQQKSSRLEFVEKAVLQALKDWLEDYTVTVDEVMAELAPSMQEDTRFQQKLTYLDSQIEKANNQRDKLHDLLEQGVYNHEIYLERNQKLMARLEEFRRQHKALEDEVERFSRTNIARQQVIPEIQHVLDAYHYTDDVQKKNNLLKSVLEKVVYNKEKWQRGDQFELTLFPLI